MANYFLDNEDIRFLFDYYDLGELARLQETDAENGDADYAPVDEADAVDNYRRVLEIVGQVSAETIAPNAEEVDRDGNTLNENGTVTLHPKVQENIWRHAAGGPDGVHSAPPLRRTELPDSALRDGQRNGQPRGRFVHEHLRAAGHRRNGQRLRQPGNQERVPAAVCQRRSDRGHGVDGAGCGKRSSGGPPAGPPGCPGQLVPQRRQTLHHQRLRRHPVDVGAKRAGDRRWPRAEPVSLRTVRPDSRPPPGAQAGHPRFTDVRAGLRGCSRSADRRTAAGIDHVRLGA